MSLEYSHAHLEAYLDELLPPEQTANIEDALRNDESLKERLAEVIGRRDAGIHSLGDIWRRHRVSCPSRPELGGYLLGVLEEKQADYVKFHLEVVACRYCTANAEDLKAEQAADAEEDSKHRRQKYYQSSAGYLGADSD